MVENFKNFESHFNELPLLEKCKTNDIKQINLKKLDEPLQVKKEIINRNELTFVEKSWIKLESGWPNEIIDNLSSMEEYKHYKNIGLVEMKIGDKPCLVKSDIDFNKKDAFGKTNAERMAQGKAPLDNEGRPIELHHIGQHNDSPLAQLTRDEHRGEGVDTLLHNKTKASEIDRAAFDKEREDHWRDFQQLNS